MVQPSKSKYEEKKNSEVRDQIDSEIRNEKKLKSRSRRMLLPDQMMQRREAFVTVMSREKRAMEMADG